MVNVSFSGGQELARTLQAMADDLQEQVLAAALVEAAEPMRARMAALAPKSQDAPHVADNIGISKALTVEGVRVHSEEAAVNVGPTKNFFYAYFLEFGTIKMHARPFVRPAYDSEAQGCINRLGSILWGLIQRRAA